MLMMGEPFSFPADELVRRINEDHAGVPVLGGMASGGVSPGENRLILGRQVYDTGAVAVLIHGARAHSQRGFAGVPADRSAVCRDSGRGECDSGTGRSAAAEAIAGSVRFAFGAGTANGSQRRARRAGVKRIPGQVRPRRFSRAKRDRRRSEHRSDCHRRFRAARSDRTISCSG